VLWPAAASDALIDGYRPGVAERFGVGPAGLPGAQPGLGVRAGQDGLQTASAGHDIAYRTRRHADRRVPPGDGSHRSAPTARCSPVSASMTGEELFADSAVIQHAAGSDLE
jgi:hypothetical protein